MLIMLKRLISAVNMKTEAKPAITIHLKFSETINFVLPSEEER